MLRPRFLGLLCASTLLGSPGPATAQGTEAANRNAYDYAVRCFAVAPLAKERGLQSDNGVRAYDMAQTLGARLGYSRQTTDSDVRLRSSRELTALLRDAAYLNKTLDDCRRLRLL